MPLLNSSLLDLSDISDSQVELLFSSAMKLKVKAQPRSFTGQSIALLFFEPSTRTRMSFESAGYRAGLGPLVFDGGHMTSLEKGETVEDSVLNIAAMDPALLVIRSGDDLDMRRISNLVRPPVINAGWGIKGHPTQALLDAFTLTERLGSLKGLRLLIVGDVSHSRVAASHFELLPRLGVELGLCSPDSFRVEKPNLKNFVNLSEALKWCDVVMSLRVQFERHKNDLSISRDEYARDYCINIEHIKAHPRILVMHPGPINQNLEIATAVLESNNSLVLEQVRNGVYLREALIRAYFEELL